MNTDLHLSDVIDYKRDIEPFRFIEIHAGPGAGKNSFIESLAKGEFPNAPKTKVLLITSRRAKVDETFTTYEDPDNESLTLFQNKIGEAWDIVDGNGNHTFATIGNTVCTYAFIEGYLRNVYLENDKRTHFWDMYDLIAIDEVHSMILDSVYQSAPFHIYNLLNHYLDRCVSEQYGNPACKHIVLMTGTPDPLQNYFPIREVPQTYLDKMQQCINIQPQNVYFIENVHVVKHLKRTIEENKRCIFFGNRIERIKEIFYDKELPQDKMVLSFSKEEKRENLLNEDVDAYNNMIEAENSIKETFRLPERFSVFLTTSRYREGINVKDNIDEMIIETHNKAEALQMAGRVRSGVKALYIVVNATQNPTDYCKENLEQKIDNIQLWGSTNPNEQSIKNPDGLIDRRCYPLNYALNEIPQDQLQKFIDLVEDKFPYIKYSYLYACFMPYVPRITGMQYLEREHEAWAAAVKNKRIPQIVGEWFPDANVHEYISERERKYNASWELWKKYKFQLDKTYNRTVIDNFKDELSVIWGYKQINKLMSMFSPYECVKAGSDKSGKRGRKFIKR